MNWDYTLYSFPCCINHVHPTHIYPRSRRKNGSEPHEESPAEYRPNATTEHDGIHNGAQSDYENGYLIIKLFIILPLDHGYEVINSASVYDNVIRSDEKYHVETAASLSVRSAGNYSYCNDTQ